MAGRTAFTHPDPPIRMPSPPEITSVDEVLVPEEEVVEQLRKTKDMVTGRDERGMDPSLGGSTDNET